MAKSWLTNIPTEIRSSVYKHYFQSINMNIHNIEVGQPCGTRYSASRETLNVLLTCKGVKDEAEVSMYSEVDFFLTPCTCWKEFHRHTEIHCDSVAEGFRRNISRIRRLTFSGSGTYIFQEEGLPKLVLAGLRLEQLTFARDHEMNTNGNYHGFWCDSPTRKSHTRTTGVFIPADKPSLRSELVADCV